VKNIMVIIQEFVYKAMQNSDKIGTASSLQNEDIEEMTKFLFQQLNASPYLSTNLTAH
jgi:hypothetical protein